MKTQNKNLIIKRCPTPEKCKYAIGQSDTLESSLSRKLSGLKLPAKVKIAIAGCSMCCTMPKIRDVGLIATHKGWKLYIGGNGGNKPRIGDLVEKNLSIEKAVQLCCNCMEIYSTYASTRMRTSSFLEKHGMKFVKENLSKLSL
jgi:NAD(P)H-nitrite reductase large subunit